uniref:Choline/carnitine acyltransferase domain-containing protein n=1 Tax=Mucochytrium quahogii TaxID=96639 RepID=A0A7S2R6H8_9STRA|mmetsp:Transcript_18321/g.29803  ORF Transcript_18321/g.29803 Transcript_18321/m.29803 type:complete len:859 (+) Transcript_18321:128-2704(+)|eukprot:CAMPEP_0203796938 /NCGR_PEP_ID=MMETSP0100_2-20121128/8297_1 /ASSEMBLY_ACC=CAM_ASM_000210 /TAXON_ID=96639 /ORGANISM=" , Strain NY0313808BC1" /LENGTH=858 /DNA_ID=CAMNT_0050702081 /DNA_START=83 /DNA_END=2659 /DNA_ORIENTATION=-
MAEARNAIDLYYLNKRGARLGPSYDGYYTVTLSIPSPSTLASQTTHFFYRLKYSLLNRLWPASPTTVLAVMSGVSYFTVTAKDESWVRTGWLAEVLWKADTVAGVLNPFHPMFPTSFRVGYLASAAAFVGMLGIVSVERLLLRGLLSWQGWMYGSSKLTTLWGAGVKLLTGKKNLTYAFNLCLPNLPVPSLSATCDRYLDSVQPLLSDEEFENTKKLVEEFQNNEGKKFQRILWFKHLFSSNYVTEWWEKYIYLYGRTPIMINSNYYILDAKTRPVMDQVQRAAGLIHHFLRFKDLVEDEKLEPMTIRGLIPLCMSQYQRMFGTTRIPGRECDELQQNSSRHVVVMSHGHYYKLNVYHGARGTKLVPYTVEELEQQLELILSHSKRQSTKLPVKRKLISRGHRIQSFEDLVVLDQMNRTNSSENTAELSSHSSMTALSVAATAAMPPVKRSRGGANIAAFTAGPRTRWAEVRELYFGDGVNRKSLHTIETAAFIVNLEDTHYASMGQRAHALFHGHGGNIWFDKSINLVVFNDGYAGLNCEHSWADAPAVAHLWEFALLNELIGFQTKTKKVRPNADESGDGISPLASDEVTESKKAPIPNLVVPRRLLWDIDDELQVAIEQAHAFSSQLIADLDLHIVEHADYGKAFIKTTNNSPDGFVQMALQLAYYRQRGQFDLTYESSMTRLFRFGRTETTRSLSASSCAFVRTMENPESSKDDRIKALRTATKNHAILNKNSMTGQGIDRHMFALYIVSKGIDVSSEFLNSALSMPWRLSTSQQPQDQTPLRKQLPQDVAKGFLSPGGGFGPVADDGYGISYMVLDEYIFFHISSKVSAEFTSSESMGIEIKRALADLASLFN